MIRIVIPLDLLQLAISPPWHVRQAPPTTLKELEEYIRNTVNKEIPRDSLEFGAELGAGEFGAVYKGDSLYQICHLTAYMY